MEIPGYTHFKDFIVLVSHLSKDALHIHLGFICLLASIALLRKSLTSYYVLLPGLVVSCVIEVLDLLEAYSSFARVAWKPSLHDLVNTNLIPFLLVTLARWRWIEN